MASSAVDRLEECYKRGLQLMNRDGNHAYAHEMFAQCVIEKPSEERFSDALLRNLRRMHPRRPGAVLRLLARPRAIGLKKKLDKCSPKEGMRDGIAFLRQDPWNVVTLEVMATACEKLRCNESELVYLKQALNSAPASIAVNRHCARSLTRMGQFDQAIACWHRVETIKRGDREAAESISRLCDERFRYPDGRPQNLPASSGAAIVQSEPAEETAVSPAVELSPIQLLETAIADDPGESENYLQLATLFMERGNLNQAEAILRRGFDQCEAKAQLEELLQVVLQHRREQELEWSKLQSAAREPADTPLPAIPWLEVALMGSLFFLIAQLVPAVGDATWHAMDISGWSRGTWAIVNLYLLLALLLIRFRSELIALWRR